MHYINYTLYMSGMGWKVCTPSPGHGQLNFLKSLNASNVHIIVTVSE